MEAKIRYEFEGKMWKPNSPGGWYFIALPKQLSKEIRENLKWPEEGWGRMKAAALINKVEWETAIWFDKKMETYLLPIKADIRKKTGIKPDELIAVCISI